MKRVPQAESLFQGRKRQVNERLLHEKDAFDDYLVRHGGVMLRRYALQVAGWSGNALLERAGDVDN